MSVSVKRIISLLLLWLLWVLFRTSGDYELFGFYLEGWSADSLLLNLFFPVVAFGLLVGFNIWAASDFSIRSKFQEIKTRFLRKNHLVIIITSIIVVVLPLAWSRYYHQKSSVKRLAEPEVATTELDAWLQSGPDAVAEFQYKEEQEQTRLIIKFGFPRDEESSSVDGLNPLGISLAELKYRQPELTSTCYRAVRAPADIRIYGVYPRFCYALRGQMVVGIAIIDYQDVRKLADGHFAAEYDINQRINGAPRPDSVSVSMDT
jgi:hypothetical protein